MRQSYSWSWVETQVAHTIELWNHGAAGSAPSGPQFGPIEQQSRERAYDEGLVAVELEMRRNPQSRAEQLERQRRILASFGQFSTRALGLQEDANCLLTQEFLPVGAKLARWARRFDASLSMPDIIQACRNAWTACGLQPLLGEPLRITPSILAYSLLYPYSDNYLDSEAISAQAKRAFGERFRDRLRGMKLAVQDSREAALWTMVQLIEDQYPRADFPQVFECLLAIHRAQQESIAQVNAQITNTGSCDEAELLRMSCAKGGSSVLADGCLVRGWLTEEESRFAFEWGVLLQLGDDLQDVHEDLQRGSVTLFSRAAAQGKPLDNLVIQLLNFSNEVGAHMEELPDGSPMLKDLLRMSWRSLIVGAVANSHQFFSPGFLMEAECSSPFRFDFLRARREKLAGNDGLYAVLFDAFLEAPEHSPDHIDAELPPPEQYAVSCLEAGLEPVV